MSAPRQPVHVGDMFWDGTVQEGAQLSVTEKAEATMEALLSYTPPRAHDHSTVTGLVSDGLRFRQLMKWLANPCHRLRVATVNDLSGQLLVTLSYNRGTYRARGKTLSEAMDKAFGKATNGGKS